MDCDANIEIYTDEVIKNLINGMSVLSSMPHVHVGILDLVSPFVNWYSISKRMALTEEHIEYFSDFVYWDEICVRQSLSEEFIERHADKVDWRYIFKYQKVSDEFFIKHRHRVSGIQFVDLVSDVYHNVSAFNHIVVRNHRGQVYTTRDNTVYQNIYTAHVNMRMRATNKELLDVLKELRDLYYEG